MAVAAVALSALVPAQHRVAALGWAYSLGALAMAGLLVRVVVRRAGAAALAGVARAAVTGVAGACAAVGAVTGLRWAGWHGGTPGPGGAAVQVVLGGVVATAIFGAVAYALDRRDLQPAAASVLRRLRHDARTAPR
jgi:putative peptidoglycan lipid II flippase